jgi:hypothetical protein
MSRRFACRCSIPSSRRLRAAPTDTSYIPALLLERVVDQPRARHRLNDSADTLAVNLVDPPCMALAPRFSKSGVVAGSAGELAHDREHPLDVCPPGAEVRAAGPQSKRPSTARTPVVCPPSTLSAAVGFADAALQVRPRCSSHPFVVVDVWLSGPRTSIPAGRIWGFAPAPRRKISYTAPRVLDTT